MNHPPITRRKFIIGVAAGMAVPATIWETMTPVEAQGTPGAAAGPIRLSLSGTRTQFTTAEAVELALVSTTGAHSLPLEIRHGDGSVHSLQVPFGAGAGPQARMISMKAGALKPGVYTASVAQPGVEVAPVTFAIARDEHPNAYFICSWMQGNADPGTVAAKGGWMHFSSDFISASVRKPAADDIMERYIAARMKPYSMTVMGGGHQMDLNPINDWGDPWVQRAVCWKMGLAALSNRIYPSAGLHAFDEPGLTWWPTQPGHQENPFIIPPHLEEFKKLTGIQMPTGTLEETMPQYKPMMDTFVKFMGLRMKYLEQAWWAAVVSVDQVHEPFITINQVASSYAPGDVCDGCDNRMNRPYRVLSGHGGYSDWAGSWGAVISGITYHGFSWDRPHYYLPMWGTFDYARMRQEVFLPWATKLEGIEYDPNHNWSMSGSYTDTNSVLEVAEVNRRLALVGDVMSRMPRTLSPYAVLISHSQYAFDVAEANYPQKMEGAGGPYASVHHSQVDMTVRRLLSTGRSPDWIDEGEVSEKGANFLKGWKVVYCPGLATASAPFRAAIEGFIAGGGKFIQSKGDRLQFPGSVQVDYPFKGEAAPPPTEGVLFNDLAQRKYAMDLAPTFAADLAGWLGPQSYATTAPVNTMLMSVHHVGPAVYLLMGNNHQDPDNTRHTQMDPIPLDTAITVPAGGVIYDLLNGGTVPAAGGQAPLHLAGGDGACWVHLPAAPGSMKLSAAAVDGGSALQIDLYWGTAGYLPFRLRILDPAGNRVDELFRATTPPDSTPLFTGKEAGGAPAGGAARHAVHSPTRASGSTTFNKHYVLGTNGSPGTWTVEAYEWMTGSAVAAKVNVRPAASASSASLDGDNISVYFEDAPKIVSLFAGKPIEPPFDKMNWDSPRVFGLDPKKFAVFGPDLAANEIAAALRGKGMTVAVNPPTEIVPFTREPGHGGTGPIQDSWQSNFENIYAHTVVLPGVPQSDTLLKNSWDRGHINRPVTSAFPGPGRAYIQWGMGGYQAGFENVWAYGDAAAAVTWLLTAIDGKAVSPVSDLAVRVKPAAAAIRPAMPQRITVVQTIRVQDTPVGVDSSPDGRITYVLLAGGSAAAYDEAGKQIWNTPALLQGGALAVSPNGERLAVSGFPGLLVLDSATGKVIDGYRMGPVGAAESYGNSRMIAAAWNSAGTIVAGGGVNGSFTSTKGGVAPTLPIALLDSNGKPLPGPQGITGNVMGLAFVPGTDTLLIGADQLTAVNAATGAVLWHNDIGGAQSFSFSADGATAAAGGWSKRAGVFTVADGRTSKAVGFDSNVGGIALLPNGDLVAAVWGGTHPLMLVPHAADAKPAPLLQSQFGFQNVLWFNEHNAVWAAEQGGKLWLLDADGKVQAMLDEDVGTTPYRMQMHGSDLLLARMNRTVQRIRVG